MFLIFLILFRITLSLVKMSVRASIALADRLAKDAIKPILVGILSAITIIQLILRIITIVVALIYFIVLLFTFILLVISAITALGLLDIVKKEVSSLGGILFNG